MPSRDQGFAFDCAICKSKLLDKGPQLSDLSFGKLFEYEGTRTPEQLEILIKEFPGYENACTVYSQQNLTSNSSGNKIIVYDCNKVMVTPCGHLFHSGCLREWYYTKRNNSSQRNKCPFCKQFASLWDCNLVYPVQSAVDTSSSEESLENISTVQFKSQCTNTSLLAPRQGLVVPNDEDFVIQNNLNITLSELREDPYWLRWLVSKNIQLWVAFFVLLLTCLILLICRSCHYQVELGNYDSELTEDVPTSLGSFLGLSSLLAAICSLFVDLLAA